MFELCPHLGRFNALEGGDDHHPEHGPLRCVGIRPEKDFGSDLFPTADHIHGHRVAYLAGGRELLEADRRWQCPLRPAPPGDHPRPGPRPPRSRRSRRPRSRPALRRPENHTSPELALPLPRQEVACAGAVPGRHRRPPGTMPSPDRSCDAPRQITTSSMRSNR